MSYSEPRYRISAKQTAKNFWQIDATVEFGKDKILTIINPDDEGETENQPIGLRLLQIIKETEDAFRKDGRKIVGDSDSQ